MDTREAKEINRYIILIPHRDSLRPLEEYRRKLFASVFCGAHAFPTAAPVARVSRPFGRKELKELAGNIRELTREKDGKILGSGLKSLSLDNEFLRNSTTKESRTALLGILLDLSLNESLFPPSTRGKILKIFPSPVLCAALVDPGFDPGGTDSPGDEPIYKEAPAISFRAASLANLAIRPIGGGDPDYSFEWRISPPVWLPRKPG